MFRMRMHGRGGQGIKTGARVLGSAFFLSDYEVQDAPLYGAERRGAPIHAFVRAARGAIHERGIIRMPDLVVLADSGLLEVARGAVLTGVDADSVLLVRGQASAAALVERYQLPCRTLALPEAGSHATNAPDRSLGTTCAAAAARLVGVIDRGTLEAALVAELSDMSASVIEAALTRALAAYDALEANAGCVVPRADSALQSSAPEWIELPQDGVLTASPAIHATRTSERMPTGLWRTVRPVIDFAQCHRCPWVCSTACPDGAIGMGKCGYPRIDLEHCKGCMVCVLACPWHAMTAVPEPVQ
jgi:pyruvate ferredoxin oxidoreductase gamma subunit